MDPMGNNISSRRTKPSSNWYRLINAFGIFFWKGHIDMASWPLTKKHPILCIYLLEIVEQNRETPYQHGHGHRKIKMGFWKKTMWRIGLSVPKQCQHPQKTKMTWGFQSYRPFALNFGIPFWNWSHPKSIVIEQSPGVRSTRLYKHAKTSQKLFKKSGKQLRFNCRCCFNVFSPLRTLQRS